MNKEERIQAISEYINDYAIDNIGVPPSVREISRGTGIGIDTVRRYIEEMKESGLITVEDGIVRTRVIDKMDTGIVMVPVVGSIPCGEPDQHEEYVEKYIRFPVSMLGSDAGKFFILRASGASMIDVGINDGDYVLIRRAMAGYDNDIVAALVDGRESTLKRIKRDANGYYLWAENRTWPLRRRAIRKNFSIQGIAVKVIKDLSLA